MIRQYSPTFYTLHDEPSPIGDLGKGAHYSILRAKEGWHTFAVIWDEDHDERVIEVARVLDNVGLLRHVLVLGESRGVVTVLVTMDAPVHLLWNTFNRLGGMSNFTFRVHPYADQVHGIINDEPRRARRYLDGIMALWSIGRER